MGPIERLELNKNNLTKSEIEIMEYIKKNPMDIVQFSIIQIAEKANTSKSAVIRLCQKIGYDGFSEFKFDMSRYLVSNNQNNIKDKNETSINAITSNYIEYISKINTSITLEEVHALAEKINSSNRVKILGINRTGLSANQLRMRLSKIGIDAESITDSVLMRDAITLLKKGDLCIIFSITGNTSPYIECAKSLSDTGCTLVLITMNPKSIISKECDSIIRLPLISKQSGSKFLDDQVIFFVFIEIILAELANITSKK